MMWQAVQRLSEQRRGGGYVAEGGKFVGELAGGGRVVEIRNVIGVLFTY